MATRNSLTKMRKAEFALLDAKKSLTKRQKIAFCKFAIDVYTMGCIKELKAKYKQIDDVEYAGGFGFCNMLTTFFGYGYYNPEYFKFMFPELYAYKPKRLYRLGYWYSIMNKKNNRRLSIIKELLAELTAKKTV
jgi:hypothetical protein